MSLDAAPAPAPAYEPLEPNLRLIKGLCAFIGACAVTFLIGSFLFVAHMQAGGYPFTFSRGWIGVMTAAGDLCLILGVGGLFLLVQFFKRGRRNIQALHLRGALSDPEVNSTILLHPGHFALTYERVVMDLWQLCAPRSVTRSSQGRASAWIPYLWWSLLLLTPLLFGIMGSLEGRYHGVGTRTGQLFIGQLYLLPYGVTILLCALTAYLVTAISRGQTELAALPRSTISPPILETALRPAKFRWYMIPAFILVLGSSYLTKQFLEHVAPKIFTQETELWARNSVSDDARDALLAGDSAQLEKLYKNFPADRTSASGVPLLDYLYRGTAEAISAAPQKAKENLKNWTNDYPHSIFAKLVQIQTDLRGVGNQPEKIPLEAIEQLDPTVRNDPHYWMLRLTALAQSGASIKAIRAAFAQAILLFPEYAPLYFRGLELTTVSNQDILETVQTAREQLPAGIRDVMTARLYWYLSEISFAAPKLAESLGWPVIATGFRALLKAYPENRNVNAFAYFACQAGDLATTKELMPKLEGQALYSIWGDEYKFGRCNIWALSAPLPEK